MAQIPLNVSIMDEIVDGCECSVEDGKSGEKVTSWVSCLIYLEMSVA